MHNSPKESVLPPETKQNTSMGTFNFENIIAWQKAHRFVLNVYNITKHFPDEEKYRKYRPEEFPGLPNTIIYGIDSHGIAPQIVTGMELKHSSLPLFILADTFNRVVFVSQGYTIGLGEQLVRTVNGL